MRLLSLFTVLLISSCITEDGLYDKCELFDEKCLNSSFVPSIPNYNDHALYVGDSLCAKVHDDVGITAQDLMGIDTKCQSDIQAMQINHIPQGYKITFIGLGTNDLGNSIPIQDFTDHYQYLADQVQGILYCVLPAKRVRDFDTEPYRNAIIQICSNIIEPWNCGVRYRAKDGIHWTQKDHIAFAENCLEPRL